MDLSVLMADVERLRSLEGGEPAARVLYSTLQKVRGTHDSTHRSFGLGTCSAKSQLRDFISDVWGVRVPQCIYPKIFSSEVSLFWNEGQRMLGTQSET